MARNTTASMDKADSKAMSNAEIESLVAKMGKEVQSQPRVPIRIPTNPYEPETQPQYAAVNGYSFRIPRNKTVLVPLCIAQVLRQQKVI